MKSFQVVDEYVVDDTRVIVVKTPHRSFLTALGEHLTFLYLLTAAFVLYLPHVPGLDVNPVNVISILLIGLAGIRIFWRRGPGLIQVALVYSVLVATAVLSSIRTGHRSKSSTRPRFYCRSSLC